MHPSAPHKIYAGLKGGEYYDQYVPEGILYSADNGQTWNKIISGEDNVHCSLERIKINKKDQQLYLGTCGNGVVRLE
ncbi:MAG: hypothetical protein A2096_04515 [Spirochaetes bacterium GWF1_41_5]|nr:MAG: hypothetical protein A2096_04515 [Spirochaetes bacterium GWF1_41_5]HBE03571.1 hypothetical protein [Spirochaetia bacterium]